MPPVGIRIVPVKQSRDDDDVRGAASPSDIRLTIGNLHHDEDIEGQLCSRLSEC